MGKKSNKKKKIAKKPVQKEIESNQIKKEIKSERKDKFTQKKDKKDKIANLVIFAVYAIFLIFAALHHELWRDEAQSWLISKNLGYFKIIDQLQYEAHPFMWYYLLRTVSLLGLKYKYITFIPVILNLITTYIILSKSKFSKLANVIIIFSCGFFFYCGVLARSYSLAYLLVVLLSLVYKDRYKKPFLYGLLLFMIMNTHILLLGFVGGLVLVDLYEFIKNKENRKPIAISIFMVIVGAIMVALQFFRTIGSTGKTIHLEYFKNIFGSMKQLFFSTINSDFLYVLTIIVLVVYLIYLALNKEFKSLIILGCELLCQVLFATMVYNSANSVSLLYMAILFILIQSEKKSKFMRVVLVIIFGLTLYSTYLFISHDYKYLFSDSENAAKFIQENIDEGSKIYCERLDYCAAINAHLPSGKYHFIDYHTEKEYTYTNYGDYYKVLNNLSLGTDDNYLEKVKMDYFIASSDDKEVFTQQDKHEYYELIYETEKSVIYSKESYLIYKLK